MEDQITKTKWDKTRLAEVCDLNMGQSPDSKTYNNTGDGLPFFQGKTDFGSKNPTVRMYCSAPKKVVEAGDILLSVRAPVGPVNVATTKSCIGRGLAGLRAKKEKLRQDFLYFELLLNEGRIASMGSGSTFHAINKSQLANFEFLLPPLLEQKSIAQRLAIIEDVITEQTTMITKLKELKKSMMRALFTHGTMGQKTRMTDIGEVPDNWKVVELIDVCDKPQYGYTDSASKKGNVKFLRITDITEDGVNWNTVPYCHCPEPEKYLLQDGDIVFARIGATTGKSFLLKNPDNAVYASYLIRVRTKDIDSAFLHYYFQTEAYWKQINSQKGTNLKGGVNGSILSKLLVPKCEKDEQKKIARSLDAVDEKIKASQAKLVTHQNLFKTLLHELMSGKRRIENV
jgi:type I restriction enzyme S subunit